MKTTLTTIAAFALVFLGSTPQAEARGHRNPRTTVYVSGHLSCGTPTYRERYIVRYDRWENPVWASRPCRAPYRPVYRPAVRPIYVAPCPPPYIAPCPPPYVRPGFAVQATWSR